MSTKRVNTGEKFRPPTADVWNAMQQAAEAQLERAFDRGQTLGESAEYNAGVLLGSNGTSGDFARFAIVELTTPPVLPDTNSPAGLNRPNVGVKIPTGATVPWGILLVPTAKGTVGRVQVAGVGWAQVNVTDTNHSYARPIAADTTKLVSSAVSGVLVLWKPSGTGTLWCLVRLEQTGVGVDGLVVQEVDGSPSYTGITTLQVPNDCGIITNPSTGVARIAAAANGTGGLINLSDQYLGSGFKEATYFLSPNGFYIGGVKGYASGNFGSAEFTYLMPAADGRGWRVTMWYHDDTFAGIVYAAPSTGFVPGGTAISNTSAVFYASGTVYAESRFAVGDPEGFTASFGGTATTGGLTFVGGLYISGTAAAGTITIGSTAVSGGSSGNLLGISSGTVSAVDTVSGGTW